MILEDALSILISQAAYVMLTENPTEKIISDFEKFRL